MTTRISHQDEIDALTKHAAPVGASPGAAHFSAAGAPSPAALPLWEVKENDFDDLMVIESESGRELFIVLAHDDAEEIAELASASPALFNALDALLIAAQKHGLLTKLINEHRSEWARLGNLTITAYNDAGQKLPWLREASNG